MAGLNQQDMIEERQKIIKWTKQLYFKQNRIVKLKEENYKHLCIREKELEYYKSQSDADIINKQELLNNQIRLILRGDKDYSGVPLTSIYLLNTKEKEALDEIKKINDLSTFTKYVEDRQRIIREREEKMTVNQILEMQRKVA